MSGINTPGGGLQPYSRSPRSIHYVTIYGGGTSVNCGSDASLDDLHAGDFTIEAACMPTTLSGQHTLISKGTVPGGGSFGWALVFSTTNTTFAVRYSLQNSTAVTAAPVTAGVPIHIAGTFSFSTDQLCRLWINGVLAATAAANAQGVPQSDGGYNLSIGFFTARGFIGLVSWLRLSRVVRYAAPFTYPNFCIPPGLDSDTIEQWNMDEGTGTLVAASVQAANSGTLATGNWQECV